MAPTGQRRAQSPQRTHLSKACGRSGSGLPAQYGRPPGTDTGKHAPPLIFAFTAAAKASISCMSRASGRPAAIVRSMECSAMKAPAAAGTKFCSVSRSHSSSKASSNARLPYTATATAGAPAPAMRRIASRAGAGTRPANTGTANTAGVSAVLGGALRENEIFSDGKKLCGMLVECLSDPDGIRGCIAGVGVYPDRLPEGVKEKYPTRVSLCAALAVSLLSLASLRKG